MKNTRIYLAVMAVTILFMTSCKKEHVNNNLGFTASLETESSDSKTTLDDNTLKWNYGTDMVRIYDANGNSDVFTALGNDSYMTTTTINGQSVSEHDRRYAELLPSGTSQVELATTGGYQAIYPSRIATNVSNPTTVTLPKVQESTNGELTEYPMYAESDSKFLQFKNLCSVLKLELKGSGTINKIELVTDQYINGTFTVSNPANTTAPLTRETYTDANQVVHSTTDDHTMVTTLTMSTPQALSTTAKYFYIYLPVQEYKYIKINIYNTDGNVYTKTANIPSGITPERSKYHLISFESVAFAPGLLNGVFTVAGATNSTPARTVSFSRGNLLSTSATSTSYKFADNQYDISNTGHTNYLFNWAGYNSSNQAISKSQTMNQRNTSISNGAGSTWNVLTQEEWKYLLTPNQRSVNYHHWTLVSVTKADNTTVAHGMIIFPDVFQWPLENNRQPTLFDISTNFSGHTWTGSGDNVLPTYTYEEWCKLEAAGCVFLPITGMKSGNSSNIIYSNYGYYWSRSPKYASNNDEAKYTYFYNAGAVFATTNSFKITSSLAIRHVKYL